MFRWISNGLLILTLLAATGAHWMALQSIAWTTMLAGNLRDGSLVQAVEQTFDGRHPCCLCKQIADGKKVEKKSEFSFKLKKFEFLNDRPQFVFAAFSESFEQAVSAPALKSPTFRPPTPPPRGVLS